MATEDKTQTEAEVKPAARKRTTRSKKAVAPQATGDAGTPAASAEAAAPAPAPKKRSTTPRKKATKAPAAEAPAAESKAEAPAPVVENAPAAPAAAESAPQEQPRKEQRSRKQHPQKNKQPQQQNQPAAPAPAPVEEKTAPAERSTDIENPDAAPQLPPAPGFAAPETVGGSEGGSGNRRKRRRNRNRNRENGQQPQQPQNTPQVDPQELVRRAWKIFLGEVTEEGLALMDDRTAAEASRRAFRVAELFLIEAARHRPSATVAEEPEAEEAPEAAEQE